MGRITALQASCHCAANTSEIRKVSKFSEQRAAPRRAGELYLVVLWAERDVRSALRTLCLRRTGTTQVGPTPLSRVVDPTWRNPSLRRSGAEATYVRQGRTNCEIRYSSRLSYQIMTSAMKNHINSFFLALCVRINCFSRNIINS